MAADRSHHQASSETDAAPEVSARATAMLPAQVLQPGELIILLLKPSPWFIVLDALGSIAWLIAIVAAALLIDATGLTHVGRRDLVLLGAALVGMRLFWQFLEWLGRVYVLTDRRVIRVEGVLRIHIFETALRNVQHTSTRFSLRERLFGLGTLSFATAGTGIVEAYWRMIAHPLDIHRIVIQTLDRYR